MDILSIALFISLLTVFMALIVDTMQWRVLRRITQRIDQQTAEWEERGTVGEQFGEWLLEPREDGVNNLQAISSHVANAMVVGINSQAAGRASGDARHQKMVDNKLFNALSAANPDLGMIKAFLTKIGLEELATSEQLPYVMRFLKKSNLLPFLNKDGQAVRTGSSFPRFGENR